MKTSEAKINSNDGKEATPNQKEQLKKRKREEEDITANQLEQNGTIENEAGSNKNSLRKMRKRIAYDVSNNRKEIIKEYPK